MKEDVLEKVTSTVKLVQLDLTNSSLHKDTSAENIGFVANKLLHDLKHTHKKISDPERFCCQDVLIKSANQVWTGEELGMATPFGDLR